MKIHLPRLAILAAALAAAVPAAAQPRQPAPELDCAVRQVPPQVRAELRARFAEGGPSAMVEAISAPAVVEGVIGCIDADAADFEARGEALGFSLMTYEIMNAAAAQLAARHGMSGEALDRAYAGLSAADKRTILRLPRSSSEETADAVAEVLMRFAAAASPGFVPADLERDERLIGDLFAYAGARAWLDGLDVGN